MKTPALMLTTTLAMACAGPLHAAPLRSQSGPYEFQVLVGGVPVPTFQHAGETYVLGEHGDRYTLRVLNHSGRRVEAVVSVDGRDAVDGRPADPRKRGYLVPAWGSVDIDGWRLSQNSAAAFRFSTVADSYAARTGSARDVGVIGVAVFPERYVPPPQPIYPDRPYYAPPPRHYYRDEAPRDDYGPAPAPQSKAAPSASESSGGRAGGSLAEREPARKSRPGLGTSFGEQVDSSVREVEFVRMSPSRPALVLGARYNDREGLLALGVDLYRYPDDYYGSDDTHLRRTADPFPADRRYATPPPGW